MFYLTSPKRSQMTLLTDRMVAYALLKDRKVIYDDLDGQAGYGGLESQLHMLNGIYYRPVCPFIAKAEPSRLMPLLIYTFLYKCIYFSSEVTQCFIYKS